MARDEDDGRAVVIIKLVLERRADLGRVLL